MPTGKKTCPKCQKEYGARQQLCDCGHSFGAKAGKVTTRRSTVPSAVVDDVFNAIEVVKKAQEQEVTLEYFVDSLELSWDQLDEITSIRELKNLKERKAYGKFVDRFGKANALRLLKKVKEKMEG